MAYNPEAFTMAMTNMLNDMASYMDEVNDHDVAIAIDQVPEIAAQLSSVDNEETATDIILSTFHEVFGENREVANAIASRMDGFWGVYRDAANES